MNVPLKLLEVNREYLIEELQDMFSQQCTLVSSQGYGRFSLDTIGTIKIIFF